METDWEPSHSLQFSMSTYYRFEFLPPVVSFVSAIAQCFGADRKEENALAVASEEAGMHIIGRYRGDGLKEKFEVVCEVTPDGLRVIFQNLGLPVNPLELPRYDIENPEDTADGLGLYLLEKLVDQHEFVNEGRKGWRTVIFKRLAHMKIPGMGEEDGGKSEFTSREETHVVEAGVEHVQGIVELVYRNYGYSYSKDVFYYPEKLRDNIASGYIRSFVALNSEGRVVGQVGGIHHRDGRDIVELSALMVQPEYRRTSVGQQLIAMVKQKFLLSPDAAELASVNAVTTHLLSQRILRLLTFSPMALKLSMHRRARFVGLAEDTEDQRENLVHMIRASRTLKPLRLNIPIRHKEITYRLFGNAGIHLEPPDTPSPPPAETSITAERNEEDSQATISLPEPGIDSVSVLGRLLFEMESDGIRTVLIRFPGWKPLPADLEAEAGKLRIFFCGWLAESSERWWLLYTRLNAQRFDFNTVQLCDPVALELRFHVESCYREVTF